ncbi:D-lyxose/D-mannose family sugar isomerase, partial [Enterobacter intestinihominis]
MSRALGDVYNRQSMHDVHLPPFARFAQTKWQLLEQAAWQEVFYLR